ncbi:MAG: hypothetical protein ACR2GD_08645 [Pyrinomonadaceae bacterium]
MLEKFNWENSRAAIILQAGSLIVLLFWLATAAFGQTTGGSMNKSQTAAAPVKKSETPKAALMPVMKDYRGVTIGMTAKEVKDKLGKAKIEDKTGFYYKFSDDEKAQIVLGKNKNVRIISIRYSSKNENAPKIQDVFGADATATPAAGGAIYKLVRYPAAGYLIVYSKGGANGMTVVTMQKM